MNCKTLETEKKKDKIGEGRLTVFILETKN